MSRIRYPWVTDGGRPKTGQHDQLGLWLISLFSYVFCEACDLCAESCMYSFSLVLNVIAYWMLLLTAYNELWAGKVILESAILTTVVVVSLTLYTFWAARRGHDFNFLGPFLFAGIMIIMVFALIQVQFVLFIFRSSSSQSSRVECIFIFACIAAVLPDGQDRLHDIWSGCGAHLLRIHHLWHR